MDPDLPRGSSLTTLVDVTDEPRLAGGTSLGDPRLLGRRLEGRYEIVRPLARGGMATVYVALDHRLDREVAVKVMHASLAHDPAFVGRFQREAKAAASIRHRNVVAVTDAGTDGDVVFLVMDLVRGRTLRALLDERGRLTPSQALEVMESVLGALAAAHAGGLVHRDVKPENVLLGDDGTLAVADFGLARAVEASSLTTHAGLLLGTVAYVSPEQVDTGHADARSDVYAAGVVLFELLTGGVPYDAATPVAVAYRHVHERVPAPSTAVGGVPPAVDALVLTATARDADHRYPTAGAFLAAVRHARQGLAPSTGVSARRGDTGELRVVDVREAPTVAVQAPQTQRTPRPTAVLVDEAQPARRQRRRWPWFVALLLVLLSAGAGVGGWLLARDVRTHVPALADRSLTAVEASLSARHLTYRVGGATHSDDVAAGQVVTTVPAPGAAVKPHSTVVIETSAGVLMVDVPAVVGRSRAAAVAAVDAAGLAAPSVTGGWSDTVPAGAVVSASPAAGRSVDHRTAVALVISQGPAPVTIPDVGGQTLADAQKTLTGLGLKVASKQDFSDTVPSGTVISADPPGGDGHRGDTVTLDVSRGPRLVAVPDLRSGNGDQARAALRALGLDPREVALFGIHGGQVVTQSPQPGSMVAPGSTVTFYTAY